MTLKKFLVRSAIGALASVALVAAWVALPVPERMLKTPPAPTLRLLDRSGASLRTTRTDEGALHQWLPLADMDPSLLTAFVAAEDRRFYTHHGVDARALGRAVIADVRAGHVVSGASTITMQLARLLTGTPRSLPGKLVQAAWAMRLDAHLSKQTILEQYLNRVPLGQGALGVEEAAELYFGASARDLSTGQAALLAGLAGAPSRDNPLASPKRALARRTLVLSRMQKAGTVSAEEAAGAKLEPPMMESAARAFLAPHYTAALLSHLGDEGRTPTGELHTPLDLPLQEALELEVRHTVETMRNQNVRHAAAVVLDNATGGILAWVGSPNFFEPKTGQVDMVISARQPGSALKPFVYGLAFDRGLTPASILPDIATVYQTSTGPYAPRNYDRRFHGPVRAREALGSSFNVPAVDLANRLGVAEVLGTLQRAGFSSLKQDANHYGLGIALGNGDVTLLELANGYRAIAAGGIWKPVRWLADDPPGGDTRRVMSAGSAALVLDILQDPVARIPGFGPITPLEFPFPAAAKTGTSRHFTDNWAVAVTGGFTVAVWVGNFDGRPMEGVSGVTGAGPLLHRVTLLTAQRHSPGVLPTPEAVGAHAVKICRLSGERAGAHCQTSTEWFLPGTEPQDTCTWHGPDGVHLPARFADWAQQARVVGSTSEHSASRRAADSASSRFHITSPAMGDVYRFVPGVAPEYSTVGLRVAGATANAAVRWSMDGKPVTTSRLVLVPGKHTVQARAGKDVDAVTIEVVGSTPSARQ